MDERKSTCLPRFRLMLGEMSDHSEANRRWENQGEEFRESNSCRESLGIDGEPIEFEGIFSLIVDPPEDPERPARSKH